ncbi:MAG: hypothetical protein IKW81_10755 [Pseudobutyrivibrio sp.]|nr:hypothetical protein [Pseudobutyrivibrio sp.]
MAKVAVGDLSVKVESMSIGDWSEAVGYVAAMVALAAVGGEIAEDIRNLEKINSANDVDINVGTNDLVELRAKLGVPKTDTIAVGKTNVKGLEGIVFEGQSPKVRKEAGLPNIDIIMPNRKIKSPGKIPSATRHAEEVVANEFVNAVEKKGLMENEVVGTLRIHQSNPTGVCPTCLSGLGNPNKSAGVIKQLSLRYPNLYIEVTSEVVDGVRVNGKLNFIVKNGRYVEGVVK